MHGVRMVYRGREVIIPTYCVSEDRNRSWIDWESCKWLGTGLQEESRASG